MAAVIVRLKRSYAQRKKLASDATRRARIRPVPNDADLILGSPVYDEEYDDAFHEKKATLSGRVSSTIWGAQPWASSVYKDLKIQMFVAALILGNFVVNIVEKQVWPTGAVCELTSFECTKDTKCNCRRVTKRYRKIFTGTGKFFNYIFTVELVWNMYAHWLFQFWSDGWNVFDFTTVAVGWIMEVGIKLPGPLGMLRMVRALRVFRLFKRVKSLRRILESLARAVPGVMNAFLIMLIVMCIYAILAVDFFRSAGRDGIFHFESGATKLRAQHEMASWANASAGSTKFFIDNYDGTGIIGDVPRSEVAGLVDAHVSGVQGRGTYFTPRGNDWGHEYFGTFGKSLFTLFQVLTGDSWAEAIGRPLLEGWFPVSTALFFVSFILLHSVVLINVVVAVLLEKMVTPEDEEDADVEDEDLLGGLGADDAEAAGTPPAAAKGGGENPPRAYAAPAHPAGAPRALEGDVRAAAGEVAALKTEFARLRAGNDELLRAVEKLLRD